VNTETESEVPAQPAEQVAANAGGRGRIEFESVFRALGHDMRTPLAALKTAVGCLLDPTLAFSPRERRDLLGVIDTAADRLGDLANELLDSSRLVNGAVRPAVRPVDCAAVVARAQASVQEGASVDVRLGSGLPPVLADPDLLERVVANVLDNALRHGRSPLPRHGRPAVSVRANAGPGRFMLFVVDHGRGLPPGAASTPPRGTAGEPTRTVGLGMAVAREFTEAMGGSIEARKTPGGGLTVVIGLPSARRNVPAHARPRQPRQAPPAKVARAREGATT
jgi:two-component system sensor histidine kinase KdpD